MEQKFLPVIVGCIFMFSACGPVSPDFQPTTIETQNALTNPSPTSTETQIPLPDNPEALAKVNWLKDNAIKLRSISPTDVDFSDLQALKQILGDKRIVMLGEESHGDGNSYLAKVRLIKFLHEEMGFDVVAFESGFYDCHKAWEMIQSGGNTKQEFQDSVFSIWSQSSQVLPLISYIDRLVKTETQLILAGFDSQFTGNISHKYLVDDLTSFMNKFPSLAPKGQDWSVWIEQTKFLISYSYFSSPSGGISKTRSDLDQYLNEAQKLQDEITAATLPGDQEAGYWIHILKSLGTQAEIAWRTNVVGGANNIGSDPEILNLRDIQMGQNLIWLANEYYSNKKIVVWAHNWHIGRNWGGVGMGYDQATVMGDVVWKALGNQIYTIGFTAYDGSYGYWGGTPQTLGQPSENSLEDLMYKAGLNYAIVDFQHLDSSGSWLQEKMASWVIYYSELSANWTKIYDGMMFIKDMTPSTKISP
jgi:erythromycin esterase